VVASHAGLGEKAIGEGQGQPSLNVVSELATAFKVIQIKLLSAGSNIPALFVTIKKINWVITNLPLKIEYFKMNSQQNSNSKCGKIHTRAFLIA
jgi:hypothetical protein